MLQSKLISYRGARFNKLLAPPLDKNLAIIGRREIVMFVQGRLSALSITVTSLEAGYEVRSLKPIFQRGGFQINESGGNGIRYELYMFHPNLNVARRVLSRILRSRLFGSIRQIKVKYVEVTRQVVSYTKIEKGDTL